MLYYVTFHSTKLSYIQRYYNKWISLLGTILCVVVMFLMDYITALITFIIIACLYTYVSKVRKLDVNWGSSTQSQSFMVALQSIQVRTHFLYNQSFQREGNNIFLTVPNSFTRKQILINHILSAKEEKEHHSSRPLTKLSSSAFVEL